MLYFRVLVLKFCRKSRHFEDCGLKLNFFGKKLGKYHGIDDDCRFFAKTMTAVWLYMHTGWRYDPQEQLFLIMERYLKSPKLRGSMKIGTKKKDYSPPASVAGTVRPSLTTLDCWLKVLCDIPLVWNFRLVFPQDFWKSHHVTLAP